MKVLQISFKSLFGILALMMLVGAWVSPAAAAAPVQQIAPTQQGSEDAPGERRLEYQLQRALIRVDILQSSINYHNDYIELFEQIIEDEQDAGRDTSALEAALEDLKAAVADAQLLHDEAAQILDEKAGFDEDGNVVDRVQARDTIQEANRTIQDARQTLRIARQDFRQALRDYREDRRGDR